MTTYTKQVYKDLPFSYKITKEGYWDKMVTKSISSNTTETVTLEPYDGVTITYNGGRIVVSSGSLPDGTNFNGFTGVTETYGNKYLYTGVGYANYATVGSPVVDKFSGTVAGFASVSYVTSPSALPTSTYFDMIQKVKFNGGTDEQCVWFTTKDRPISFESAKLGVYQSGWHQGTNTYAAGVYWIRAIYDNGTLKLYALADNNYTLDTLPAIDSWTLEVTLESCLDAWSGQTLMLSRNNGTYWKSEMYLSGTKVSTDSEVIWTAEGEYGEILQGVMVDNEGSIQTTYKTMYAVNSENIALYFNNSTTDNMIWLGTVAVPANLLGKYQRVNFDQVGDVTYTDNTVSLGRSSSLIANKNTPTINEFFPVTIDLTMKITPSDISGYNILYRDSAEEKGVGFYNGAFRITGGTQGSAVLENSKTYWVRFTQTPETSSFTFTGHYMEDDGTYTIDTLPEVTDSSWTQGFSVSSQLIVSNALFYIGDLENKNDTFKGSIDLESVLMRSGTGSNLTDYWKPLGTY